MVLGPDEWGYIAGILFDSERYRDLVRLSRTSKLVHQGCSKEMEKMSLVCTLCKWEIIRERPNHPITFIRYLSRGETPSIFSPIGYALSESTGARTMPRARTQVSYETDHPIRFDCSSWRRRGLLPAEIEEHGNTVYVRWVTDGETYCVERHHVRKSQRGDYQGSGSDSSLHESLDQMDWQGLIPYRDTNFLISPDSIVLQLWVKQGRLHRGPDRVGGSCEAGGCNRGPGRVGGSCEAGGCNRESDLPAVTTGNGIRIWFRDGVPFRDGGRPVVVSSAIREPKYTGEVVPSVMPYILTPDTPYPLRSSGLRTQTTAESEASSSLRGLSSRTLSLEKIGMLLLHCNLVLQRSVDPLPISRLIGVFEPSRHHLGVDLPTVLFEDDLPPSILRRLEREYTHPMTHECMREVEEPRFIVRDGVIVDVVDKTIFFPIDELNALIASECALRMERLESAISGMQGREFPVYETISNVKGTLIAGRIEYQFDDDRVVEAYSRCRVPWPLPD